MRELMCRFLREEDGQGMVEYGLILALVAVVVIVALTALGVEVDSLFRSIFTDAFGGTVGE